MSTTEMDVDAPPEACETCSQVACRCDWCGDCSLLLDPEADSTEEVRGNYYHRACLFRCANCGAWESRSSRVIIDDSPLCEECWRWCPDCVDNRIRRDADRCRDCEDEYEDDEDGWSGGLMGYQRTYARTWLGGQDADFHIGFELEISAESSSVAPVYDWAGEHLGGRSNLDCKEDCSVYGFEIATQPMTPEFFESVDWESFFGMLGTAYPARYEPEAHGLHVHIGRIAFRDDAVATAMFSYLLAQDDGSHLERVGRRMSTGYCRKVAKPVGTALLGHVNQKFPRPESALVKRLRDAHLHVGRDAINHSNPDTIEIRAFKSTRQADDLRSAVRLVYLAARYVKHLRTGLTSPQALRWDSFVEWVQDVMPEAADALAVPSTTL